MTEVFTQIDNLTTMRRIRLHLSTRLVPDVIWIALFTGAFLTIAFTLFFGAESTLAQLAMTAILTIIVTLGLRGDRLTRSPVLRRGPYRSGIDPACSPPSSTTSD